MRPLLILVDLQQDYLNSSYLEPMAGVVVHGAAKLLAWCRKQGIPVAHVWTTVSRIADNRLPHWKQANIWQCVEGTPGHQPPTSLAPLEGEPIFHKTGFTAFTSKDLADFARRVEIDAVIVAGIKTHACVRQLVLEAWHAGLAVWVASDAIASDDPLHAVTTRRYLEARGVNFLSNAEITAGLDNDAGKRAVTDQGLSGLALAAINFHAWRDSSRKVRANLVRRLVEVLTPEIEHFAVLMAKEIGKPLRFGRSEAKQSVEMLESIVGRAEWEDTAAEKHADYTVRRRPHGVIAVVTPWNNPIYIALGKIVPAILYGNAVVWKPAPETRMVSRHLFQCLVKANWPEGLVNLLEGGQHEAEVLMHDRRIEAVTITGSSTAGYSAQEICARRRVPLQAELGGNNAGIVWLDADLQAAAQMVAAGAFEMAGQRCTANRRVIIQEACCEEFIQMLLKATASLKWGDPLDVDTDIGPLVSASERDRVAEAVERAVAESGRPLLPLGEQPPTVEEHAGKFYPPTILYCDDPAREIVQEETFGPALVVQPAQDWDDAMRLCNGVRQGLSAAVFTTSRDIAQKFLEQARAGILKVNQSTAGAAVDAPFGGWKASGVGTPEHGGFDAEFFTRPQTVYGDKRFWGWSS
jgi:acyl-CoA reductase-like NAD-dependent aldehyde dehydrogenase/nicotinamidase-related amidase